MCGLMWVYWRNGKDEVRENNVNWCWFGFGLLNFEGKVDLLGGM